RRQRSRLCRTERRKPEPPFRVPAPPCGRSADPGHRGEPTLPPRRAGRQGSRTGVHGEPARASPSQGTDGIGGAPGGGGSRGGSGGRDDRGRRLRGEAERNRGRIGITFSSGASIGGGV